MDRQEEVKPGQFRGKPTIQVRIGLIYDLVIVGEEAALHLGTFSEGTVVSEAFKSIAGRAPGPRDFLARIQVDLQ